MPFGAEVRGDGSVRFRLWAPKATRVELSLVGPQKLLLLNRLDEGWFELITREAKPGTHYRFRIDEKNEVPDPASRFQPLDVNGPSEVINPQRFEWRDDKWHGRPWYAAVIYELHVGAFTSLGTFRAAEEKLSHLSDLGITAIELMPVADFAGRRNWGYDGVLPFAPDSSYGHPDELKHLVQSAHEHGLMIFLDVVYNHFGPEGNYLRLYSPEFFTSRHSTPWGDAINFDGSGSRVVRDFFIHNALYWLEEYRFDGLRLDAVHEIADDSKPDILTELAETVRAQLGNQREIHLMLENADNAAHYLARDDQLRVTHYDAQWNDDIHHALHVLVTGESDGYYRDFTHNPIQHLCRCLTQGFAYQGGYSAFHGAKRGEPSTSLPLTAFISFLQNHDQIGNRASGERIVQLTQPEGVRAAMEILLLAPAPPLLFMGEEFGATSPFLYFCDFQGDLASAVTNGRRKEFARFARFSSGVMRDQIPDPNSEQTFLKSKLNWDCLSDQPQKEWLRLYRELLSLRHRVIVPHLRANSTSEILSSDEKKRTFAIRWSFSDGLELHLRANLGREPVALEDVRGTRVYHTRTAESQLKEKRLPNWSVVWSIVQ